MKKVLLILLALVLALVLACTFMPGKQEDEADTLSLYYPVPQSELTGGRDAIDAVKVDWRDMREAGIKEQAEEILRLLQGGCEDSHFHTPLPANTRLLSCQVSGSTVWVDFSAAYAQQSGMALTIADYCVALSLVQIPGVYTVRITVNGRELAYRDRNYFRADDVLLTSQEDVVRNVAAQLYFLKDGALSSEERILTVYEGESQTGAVMEALLAGPEDEELQPLLPEGFSILSVKVEENVCYLNLPASGQELLPEDALQQRQIIVGMVRSLCSIRDVWKIQVLVDGERSPSYGSVDISQPMNIFS